MTRRPGAADDRRGITLTEILISILIMGVGLISLATLFPLGMVRLRAAQQQSRSALLAQSATADLTAQNLLFKPSFSASWYPTFDPFTNDPIAGGGGISSSTFGVGLPICYDPLWWYEVGPNVVSGSTTTPATTAARFGAGVVGANSFLQADPDGGTASAYGLQRLTNFYTTTGWAFVNPETVFVSPDDPVMQNSDATPELLSGPVSGQSALSGVVPQYFPASNGLLGGFRNDFRYTWLFTGYQVDSTNGTAFVGDIVVMDSRPFGYGSVTSAASGTASNLADGEIPLEAIFGYGNTGGAAIGYGVAADRVVLLRWPNAMPDPEIKVGSWIADVTYERNASMVNAQGVRLASAAGSPVYPFQRCYWYQVAKRNEVQSDPDVAGYRRLIVTVNTPVKARTLLNSGGTAVNLNAALFMPSVVNTFQRTIFIRTDR